MKILAAVIAFCFVTAAAQAQSGMAVENWKDIKLGPMFTAGAAVNAGTVDSLSKTSPAFSWAAGGRLIYPFSAQIAFDLGLCYDVRAIGFSNSKNSAQGSNDNFGYLAIRPAFDLGAFMIGLGIGIPVSMSETDKQTGTTYSGPDFNTSDMNLLVEGRIGGNIDVLDMNNGSQLRFLIEGLIRIYEDPYNFRNNTNPR